MNTLRICARGTVLLSIGLLLLSTPAAKAVTFTITDTNDDGTTHSLRAAIRMANAISGKNTIVLGQLPKNFTNPPPRLTFHLTMSGADENAAHTGDLDITRDHLEINAAFPGGATIDATGLGDRVFQVDPKASLTLENVTIQGGTSANGEFGGAIYNSGTLTLLYCTITNNSGGTTGGDGGGIYNTGILSAVGCDINGNSAVGGFGVDGLTGNGGGIRNDGDCFLTNCIIDGNQSGAGIGYDGLGFAGGNGGGILNIGKMILNHCFISGNASGSGSPGGGPFGDDIPVGSPGTWGADGGSGAGIYNVGDAQLDFSTVYGNVTGNGGHGGVGANAGNGGDGAGIFNAGQFRLNTCTISSNLCGSGGQGGIGSLFYIGVIGGTGGRGGGIFNADSLVATSCTITLNQTGEGGTGGDTIEGQDQTASGGPGGDGGGIWNDAISSNAVIRNTIVAQNLVNVGGIGGTNFKIGEPETYGDPGPTGLGFDVAGDFTSQGFNLIGMADDSTGFTNGVSADQTGTDATPLDPRLSSALLLYVFSGGQPSPFVCYQLFGGSPATDQGNSFGITVDIGGAVRPYDFSDIPNAIGGDGSDIGSYEARILLPNSPIIIIPPTPIVLPPIGPPPLPPH